MQLVTFPEAFSQGFFWIPAHFKAFRANYTKVHGKAIKRDLHSRGNTSEQRHPRELAPEPNLRRLCAHTAGRSAWTAGRAGGAGSRGAAGEDGRAQARLQRRETGPRAGSGHRPRSQRAHAVPTSSGENENITPAQGPGTPQGDQTEPGSSRHQPGKTFPSAGIIYPHHSPTSSLL